MTISSTTRKNEYVGSGITGPYPYTFRVFAATHLLVKSTDLLNVETILVYGVDFTATDVGELDGGTITLTEALPDDYGLSIERVLPMLQPTGNLLNQGPYFPSAVEDALDRGVMIDQQLSDGIASLELNITIIEDAVGDVSSALQEALDADDVFSFPNPMYAVGDLIVGGAVGSPQRLGIGGPDTVLINAVAVSPFDTAAGDGDTLIFDFTPAVETAEQLEVRVDGVRQVLDSDYVLTAVSGDVTRPAWSETTAYSVSDAVSRAGLEYVCVLAHVGHEPPNATYWKPITLTRVTFTIAPADEAVIEFLAASLSWAGPPTGTPGDLLYINAAGEWARLGVGNDSDVLTLANGLPAWVPLT